MATANNAWPIPASTDYVKNGYDAIDDLGNAIDTSVGTGLLAWTSWAPTLSGGWVANNGTFDAKYAKLGKIVLVSFQFTVGSLTTKGTAFTTTLPVTARTTLSTPGLAFLDGSSNFYGLTLPLSTTTLGVVAQNVSGTYTTGANVSSTVPVTWTTGDVISFSYYYEAA